MNGHFPVFTPGATIVHARPITDPFASAVSVYDYRMMVSEWVGMEYAELSALLTLGRFLQIVHQTNHWISAGDAFYGDHLLFERLYESISGHVDSLAERIVGLTSERGVDPALQVRQLGKLFSTRPNFNLFMSMPRPSDLAAHSFEVEVDFGRAVTAASDGLKAKGLLTYGLDNLLAQLADDHEKSMYLLKQKCGGGV